MQPTVDRASTSDDYGPPPGHLQGGGRRFESGRLHQARESIATLRVLPVDARVDGVCASVIGLRFPQEAEVGAEGLNNLACGCSSPRARRSPDPRPPRLAGPRSPA